MKFIDAVPAEHYLLNDFKVFVTNTNQHIRSFIKNDFDFNIESEVNKKLLQLYIKSINTLTSISILFETINIVDARILMRSLYENSLLFLKLSVHQDEYIKYDKAREYLRQLFIYEQQLSGDFNFNGDGLEVPDSKLIEDVSLLLGTKEEIKKQYDETLGKYIELGFLYSNNKTNGKPSVESYFSLPRIAEEFELTFIHDTIYKNLSLDSHSSSTHYYKYFLYQGDEIILNIKPYQERTDFMISMTILISLNIVEKFKEYFLFDEEFIPLNNLQELQAKAYSIMPLIVKQAEQIYK
ncbi:DUF5677 domain-containing protein [Sutcliffiella horikoshii]|uniref:DUF5677 domain-containing protein n=1 Tax=Sutcliffiella horikoshii TaxID=79883 RepID=UPI00203B5C19|nr:DUF5677 domain-containing protein [Sutcliffiella horikoshii]MCM3619652.1 DUF5677 domain-containing protein [Sutcliffiella horikoshii]